MHPLRSLPNWTPLRVTHSLPAGTFHTVKHVIQSCAAACLQLLCQAALVSRAIAHVLHNRAVDGYCSFAQTLLHPHCIASLYASFVPPKVGKIQLATSNLQGPTCKVARWARSNLQDPTCPYLSLECSYLQLNHASTAGQPLPFLMAIRTAPTSICAILLCSPACKCIILDVHDMQEFDTVLNISFGLMLGVYGTVAALGYYYFGSSAHTLLTTDLARNSPFSGHYFLLPGLTADKLVALSIMLNAYSTYPSLVLVMQVSSYSHHLMLFKACVLPLHKHTPLLLCCMCGKFPQSKCVTTKLSVQAAEPQLLGQNQCWFAACLLQLQGTSGMIWVRFVSPDSVIWHRRSHCDG